ncbi:metallophosphoesterase [Caloramator sp. CAR-1]|uniref:metallophosphoesterase family protein n=1 Tax=Caloramator sp. CAR-1 TaxID=3062777 RepID=UPI0026E11720|nr:metallophosphoesterase [Caloramator sp. CAR-1]MDO6354804.1 metallophosphoesterase [Caloramator sp. CAR-1]
MAFSFLATSDLHIGMKFKNYSENVSKALHEARLRSLENLVKIANEKRCGLFLIAGDLFESTADTNRKYLDEVISTLRGFNGEYVAILPGNHDFFNISNFWVTFINLIKDTNIIVLNEYRQYNLEINDEKVVLYPAYCDLKHSKENRLDWIKEYNNFDKEAFNILVSHGSIKGISPDLKDEYFGMSIDEINALNVDIAIVGHMHINYPFAINVKNEKLLIPGTPEPDGLDCKHEGYAWIVEVLDKKNFNAIKVKTGIYRFIDERCSINSYKELENYKNWLLEGNPRQKVVRVDFSGSIEEERSNDKNKCFDELSRKLFYFEYSDNIRKKFDKNQIDKEFVRDSLPHRILSSIDDKELLELAYENRDEHN